MKKMKKTVLLISLVLLWTAQAWAVPVLQVGVPDGSGGYVDYTTVGFDEDTAFTSGNILSVAGSYGPNASFLGGQYSTSTITGESWTQKGYALFEGRGAVLMVTVPDEVGGAISGTGMSLIASNLDVSYFPNGHYPTNAANSKFWYFDIGNFADTGVVPDFETETGAADGEIKNLAFTIMGFSTAHFDLMALETDELGQAKVKTSVENNPPSHDVTWINPSGGGGGFGDPIPEPGTILLLGTGLVGLAYFRKKQAK